MPPTAPYIITPYWMQPVRSANDTAEYRANFVPAELGNALYALDSGHTGQGVTVGVTDDGVVSVNGELDGRISSLSKDFGYVTSGGVPTRRDVLGDAQSDHGTAVANILGAAANGKGTVGYAPSVQIAVLRISDWNADTKTEVLTHLIEAIDYAGRQGIKILNSSVSGTGSASWGAAVARYAVTGGLIVNSAGNAAGDSPIDAPAINDTNKQAILFVGAISPYVNGYVMESYSNRAGTMKDRYVVAVGRNYTTDINGAMVQFSGTSSAAPMVSALAADILSKWPQLTGQQAGDIILNTARDLGEPGVDAVFGHGLVDFKAALSPVQPTLSNGTTQTSLDTSIMAVPSAIGATSIQTALSKVTVLDAYGRDFAGSLAGMVLRPQAGTARSLQRRVEQMNNYVDLSAGRFVGGMAFANYRAGPEADAVRSVPVSGTMAYVSGKTGVRLGWNTSESLQSDVMGLAPFADGVLAYVPQADTSFGVDRYMAGGKLSVTTSIGAGSGTRAQALTLGWSTPHSDIRASLIEERGTVLGVATGTGALRLGRGASTAMVEAHHSFDLGDTWQVEGYGSVGVTRLKVASGSLVTGATPLIGTRLGVQVTHRVRDGAFSLGIAQPLTIESGSARLTYGTGYDLASQSLVYSSTSASLAGARRLQLTAGYVTGGPRSSFRLGVAQDVEQGSTRALAGWSIRW